MALTAARSMSRPNSPLPRSWEKWKPSYTGVMDSRLRKTQLPTADGSSTEHRHAVDDPALHPVGRQRRGTRLGQGVVPGAELAGQEQGPL